MATKRQKTDRCTERNDAQPQRLLDFRTVAVDQVGVDARDRALRVATAKPDFEVVAKADQVVGADHDAVEIANLKNQRELGQIVYQHVVRRPSIFATRAETAD